MATYDSFANNTANRAGYEVPLQHTPSHGFSDGIAPAGTFRVAPYLPLLRYNEEKFVHIVIATGKIVAFDSTGAIVPAGLRLEAAAYATGLATDVATADAAALVRYTSLDVQKGIKNFKGVLVTANEPVVKSFFTGTTLDNEVSFYCGVTMGEVFAHAGGNNQNPTQLTNTNFNRQPNIGFMCDYHQQYAVVKDVATVRSAPQVGVAAFVAGPSDFAHGTFVTYDRESNFVPCAKHGFGSTNMAAVIGQITGVTIFRDSTTAAEVTNHNFLDKIVAPNAATASAMNQIPNSQNDGKGTYLIQSNGYAVVEFGLHFR